LLRTGTRRGRCSPVSADSLRTKLKALVEEWGAEAMKERMESPSWAEYSPDDLAEVQEQCARELAALLAESEPEDDPVGHEFVGCDYSAGCDWCHYRVGDESCCQPRSAHEPK
jgi:hypothetical protein